jgi:RNA polymerase-interacting CarD/CdnL/TRCF family regulator
MLQKAWQVLASELALARQETDDEASTVIGEVLSSSEEAPANA